MMAPMLGVVSGFGFMLAITLWGKEYCHLLLQMRKSRLRGGVTGPEPMASRRWSQGLNPGSQISSSLRQRAPPLGRRKGSQRGLLRGGDLDLFTQAHLSNPTSPQKQGHKQADPHLVPSAQRRPWGSQGDLVTLMKKCVRGVHSDPVVASRRALLPEFLAH